MKRWDAIFKALVSVVFLLALATVSQAQLSFRTWVAGNGNDANPCTHASPCQTFAAAITQTASGGEINAKSAGEFGPVIIDKSITIDGGGTFSGIVTTGAIDGVRVNDQFSATPNTAVVTLRNLSMNGSGAVISVGVSFSSGKTLNIENCRIANFYRGVDISVNAAVGNLNIKNTTILNTSRGVQASAWGGGFVTVSLNGCNIEQNELAGIELLTGSDVSIRDSVIQFNYYGVRATGNTVNIVGSQVNHNATGLDVSSGTTATIGSSTFMSNATNFSNSGTIRTFGNNQTETDPIPGVVTNLGLR